MSRKNRKKSQRFGNSISETTKEAWLSSDAKKSVWAIAFFGIAIILALAAAEKAGPAGNYAYGILHSLLGVGYFVPPAALATSAIILIFSEKQRSANVALLGVALIVFSVLGIIHIFSSGQGGWLGFVLGSLQIPFGKIAAAIINFVMFIAAFIVASNTPLKIKWPSKKSPEEK